MSQMFQSTLKSYTQLFIPNGVQLYFTIVKCTGKILYHYIPDKTGQGTVGTCKIVLASFF